MAELTQAAVLRAPRSVTIEDIELPAIGEHEGLLRVEGCAVCGSDVPVYRGDVNLRDPVVLGHEIVGRVQELGDGAAAAWGVRAGDRVVVERWLPCGRCDLCRRGLYRLCVPVVGGHRLFYGGAPLGLAPGLYGGYARHLYLHPSSVVYRIAEHVDTHAATLVTPIANSISWLRSGKLAPGETLAILGPGQEGLCAVLVARFLGAGDIVVVGLPRDEGRLRLAEQLGATATVMSGEDDAVEVLAQLTSGAMADVVLDVTSARDSGPVATALRLAGLGGRIVLGAEHPVALDGFDAAGVLTNMLQLIGVRGRDRRSFQAAIRALERGDIDVHLLEAHAFELADTDRALHAVETGVTDVDGTSVPVAYAVVQP